MEQYIQPFIEVSQKVFEEFVGCKLAADRPYFEEKENINDWDISAVIGLTGEARGAVVISMKTSLATRITDILTGTSHTELDDEVVDAVGEIVNIIAGNVKKDLEESFRLIISLPTIVQGTKHVIKWPSGHTRVICIPFNIFENERFVLSVAVESLK
jgi:chemotaxis protein CheX